MVNGNFQGPVTNQFPSGNVLEGTIVDGIFQGPAVERYTNGDILEGTMVNGELLGPVTKRFAGGDVLEGTMVDDKFQGPATKRVAGDSSTRGFVLEGTMVDDVFQGPAKKRVANRNALSGMMVDGQFMTPHQIMTSHQELERGRKRRREAELDELSCPITLALMKDPVVASDGHPYERAALHLHMQRDPRSPITREPLNAAVFPNRVLLHVLRQHHLSQ